MGIIVTLYRNLVLNTYISRYRHSTFRFLCWLLSEINFQHFFFGKCGYFSINKCCQASCEDRSIAFDCNSCHRKVSNGTKVTASKRCKKPQIKKCRKCSSESIPKKILYKTWYIFYTVALVSSYFNQKNKK